MPHIDMDLAEDLIFYLLGCFHVTVVGGRSSCNVPLPLPHY
jgi:hypothetical protein